MRAPRATVGTHLTRRRARIPGVFAFVVPLCDPGNGVHSRATIQRTMDRSDWTADMTQAVTGQPHTIVHATPERMAFGSLKPISPDYPTLAIDEAFNWSDALSPLESGTWYLVVFRSIRKEFANTLMLTEYDDRAHREALEGEGLLFYFQGQLNGRRECLSFCVWQNQQQAQAGARLPLHQAAASISAIMYDEYHLERYHIRKEPITGAITFARVTGKPADHG
ncbi:MAG: protein PB2B2 [Chloroflexi bacterium]|nr:protein PB2B2 [Chloroflexota bacterium]